MNKGLIDSNLSISFIKSEVNCLPRSVRHSLGIPTLENISTKASATEIVSIDLSGIASGNLVAISNTVKIYLWPSDEAGDIGPTMSIEIRENGVVIIGMDCSSTGRKRPF